MLGAILGDIAGSRFEWNNIKSKEFELLTYTDQLRQIKERYQNNRQPA